MTRPRRLDAIAADPIETLYSLAERERAAEAVKNASREASRVASLVDAKRAAKAGGSNTEGGE